MIIEATICEVLNHLYRAGYLPCPAYTEEPEARDRPDEYYIVEKTGESKSSFIYTAQLSIQSYGVSLLRAAALSKLLEAAAQYITDATMIDLEPDMYPGYSDIGGMHLVNSYNWSDTTTARYRYQSIYDVSYAASEYEPYLNGTHTHGVALRPATVGTARTGIDRV